MDENDSKNWLLINYESLFLRDTNSNRLRLTRLGKEYFNGLFEFHRLGIDSSEIKNVNQLLAAISKAEEIKRQIPWEEEICEKTLSENEFFALISPPKNGGGSENPSLY